MKITRLLAAGAMSAIAALALAACSSGSAGSDAAEASDPFRVVAILPMTGPLSKQSEVQVNGLKASAKIVNADGGIGGRDVEVKVLDSKLDPTEAVTLLQEEINSDTPPDYVWAGATSNEALAMLPALSSAGILSGSTAADIKINNPELYPYHFGMQSANNQNYQAFVDYAKNKGFKKVGFISANDALGTYNHSAITEMLANTGIELVTQSYDTTATDLTAPMDALKAADPDVLFASSYGSGVGYIFDARQKLDWDVPVVGDNAVGGSNPAAIVAPEALKGVQLLSPLVSATAHKDEWLPDTQKMIDAISAEGDISQIVTQASLPYDALQLLALAAKQASATDADALKGALEGLKTPDHVTWTSYPAYGFSPENHFPKIESGYIVFTGATKLVNGQFQ
ncbi:ABC transporter substrate-binding protein [Arthrobacter sp. I2-34]|uniref:ABC transporter substrate-binding protein n=1 Tax=Arthrobacter hankyongi TaxID=2904801 RepID=A0ABS9L3J1_9MICC|nr:ABC transporter substrate-binding protein [Arthrobacter hankyongi]MCG2621219.1 ABC transporter substrate-binding protein [Arthrobacter hankyongi]